MHSLLVGFLVFCGLGMGIAHGSTTSFAHHGDNAYRSMRIVEDSPIYAKMKSTYSSTGNGYMTKYISSGSGCGNIIQQNSNITGVCLTSTDRYGNLANNFGYEYGSWYFYCQGANAVQLEFEDSACSEQDEGEGTKIYPANTCLSSEDYYGYVSDGEYDSWTISCSSTLPAVAVPTAFISKQEYSAAGCASSSLVSTNIIQQGVCYGQNQNPNTWSDDDRYKTYKSQLFVNPKLYTYNKVSDCAAANISVITTIPVGVCQSVYTMDPTEHFDDAYYKQYSPHNSYSAYTYGFSYSPYVMYYSSSGTAKPVSSPTYGPNSPTPLPTKGPTRRPSPSPLAPTIRPSFMPATTPQQYYFTAYMNLVGISNATYYANWTLNNLVIQNSVSTATYNYGQPAYSQVPYTQIAILGAFSSPPVLPVPPQSSSDATASTAQNLRGSAQANLPGVSMREVSGAQKSKKTKETTPVTYVEYYVWYNLQAVGFEDPDQAYNVVTGNIMNAVSNGQMTTNIQFNAKYSSYKVQDLQTVTTNTVQFSTYGVYAGDTYAPSRTPTFAPSGPSRQPTVVPTVKPTIGPSAYPYISVPTKTPTPSRSPTASPTVFSSPSTKPTAVPTVFTSPTVKPSTMSPSMKPTAVPTVKPTAVPTVFVSPTMKPSTKSPSVMPTAVPTINENYYFAAYQTLSGISASTYNSDPASNNDAVTYSVAEGLTGVTQDQITITGVSSSNLAPAAVAADRRALTGSDVCYISYTVAYNYVTLGYASPSDAYSAVSTELDTWVDNGDFSTTLEVYATNNGVTDMATVTSTTVTASAPVEGTPTTTSSGGGGSSGANAGVIAGSVIGVIAGLIFIAAVYHFVIVKGGPSMQTAHPPNPKAADAKTAEMSQSAPRADKAVSGAETVNPAHATADSDL